MEPINRLCRLLNFCFRLPAAWRLPAATWLFGSAVKFFRTAGIAITGLDHGRVSMRLHNRRRVQNHIKGVHAAATALLGESASGLLVGVNLPDSHLPLLKNMKVDYLRRAVGDVTAIAELSMPAQKAIRQDERGDVAITVRFVDSEGNEPVAAEYVWAWRPKK